MRPKASDRARMPLGVIGYFCCMLILFGEVAEARPPKAKIVRQEITSKGRSRSYYLFVPESVSADRPVPLLVTLHGQGRSGLILVEEWKKLAEKEGIILVGPDALSATWSIPEDGPDFVHDVVEEVRSKRAIDPRRMYLFGHSAGGTFGLYISLLESELFAAAALHAAAMRLPEDRSFLGYATRKIPILLLIGVEDPLVPLQAVRQTREALMGREIPTTLDEIRHHNHNYYAKSDEINRRAWEFLKEHKLTTDPHYTQYR